MKYIPLIALLLVSCSDGNPQTESECILPYSDTQTTMVSSDILIDDVHPMRQRLLAFTPDTSISEAVSAIVPMSCETHPRVFIQFRDSTRYKRQCYPSSEVWYRWSEHENRWKVAIRSRLFHKANTMLPYTMWGVRTDTSASRP